MANGLPEGTLTKEMLFRYLDGFKAPDRSTVPLRQPAQQPEIMPNLQEQQPPQEQQQQQTMPMDEITRAGLAIQTQEAERRKILKEQLARLTGGLGGMEDALRLQLGQKAQLDLSPLAALSDSISKGGKLSQGYTRPQTANENAQQGLSNLAALQQRREQLAELATKQTSDPYLKLMMARERQDGTQKRFDERESKITDKQVENINKMESAMQETAELGRMVEEDFVGPTDQFKGSFLGKQIPGNEKAAAFQSRLGALVDTYRHMVTGSAAADAELKRIESRMPQGNENEKVFREKAQEVIKRLQTAHKLYLDDLEKKGKNVSNYRTFSFSTSVKKKNLDEMTNEELEAYINE